MKKQIKSLLLVALFIGMTAPAWGQASTQGKEFWVSSTIVCSPDKKTAEPYIAVSAEKECTVKIQGGEGNAINITQKVSAGSWTEFGNGNASQLDPTVGPVKVPMDASKWYPIGISNADNVISEAGKMHMYGLHITATEKISVYVILRSPYSMDASNILPMTALGSEYYTQDYKPDANDFSKIVGMTTILATEDGTKVDIIPNGNTYDSHPQGVQYTIELKKGQIYYLISKVNEQLTGTRIIAKGGKKIAVFNGTPLTRLPNGLSARDCLFEQSMPVEYWGTQFIATRSLGKDGNLIGITGTQPNTEIMVDGYTQAMIGQGETYYILLQSENDPYTACQSKITSPIDQIITGDVAYIETSCPCAVYCYDTGNNFKGKTATETNGNGDPSSVWVSPIQQKIGKITFGTCYTDKTKDHFLNVVTETSTCSNTKLTAIYGKQTIDKSSLLIWAPVPGNPKYSYARAQIGDNGTKDYNVFRLENSKGFIANIYGNGEDESYAYSAGSSAVEQGINVNEITFVDGFKNTDDKFCLDEDITFDANGVGTDEVTRVDWNFGDGIAKTNGAPLETHQYTSPGWYDVTARLYGHQVCTDESEQFLGSVSFSFRVVRADTTFVVDSTYCFTPEEYAANPAECDKLIAEGKNDTITDRPNCYDPVVIQRIMYGRSTASEYNAEGRDSAQVNGTWYFSSQDVEYKIPNRSGCDSIITCHLKVITCLGLSFSNDTASQHACFGESMALPYVKTKGDIGKVRFVIPNVLDEVVEMDNANTDAGILDVPTFKVSQPGIYTAQLFVEDVWCDPLTFNFDIAVYYPADIFAYKFNNVLAVYKYGRGGNRGWEFTGYQWYRNGEPINGATESVCHIDGTFAVNDEVYVVLLDKNGQIIPSCPQTIETVPSFSEQSNDAPARKMIVNRQMVIIKGDKTYDIYGQRVQ